MAREADETTRAGLAPIKAEGDETAGDRAARGDGVEWPCTARIHAGPATARRRDRQSGATTGPLDGVVGAS